jgi:hypothetical protein
VYICYICIELTFDKAQPLRQDVVCLVLDEHFATVQSYPCLRVTTQFKQPYRKNSSQDLNLLCVISCQLYNKCETCYDFDIKHPVTVGNSSDYCCSIPVLLKRQDSAAIFYDTP